MENPGVGESIEHSRSHVCATCVAISSDTRIKSFVVMRKTVFFHSGKGYQEVTGSLPVVILMMSSSERSCIKPALTTHIFTSHLSSRASESLSVQVINMSPLLFPLLVALAFGQASSQLQCKEGYVQFQDSCYSLTGASDDTWANAEQQCKFSGGHLVSISNKEENEFVKSLFEKTDNKVVWIGGNRVEPQKHQSWRWVDGANMEYDNWGAGQPRNFREKNSMMMFKDGTWGNEDGTLRYAFICKESQRPTCDDDYYLYGSQCYAFKEAKLGFGAAQKNRRWQPGLGTQRGAECVSAETYRKHYGLDRRTKR
ncbi:C-type mannose receptor 2-like [Engraulis encrasicolus]|uniref:C-type mannose receptor 2-like n=1 Tax=Engraulis encrasicolus TaxID=184585 RepID=UPI002FD6174F